jgi:hypothetical protein
MQRMRSETTEGLLLALPGLMNGSFTLPMQRMPKLRMTNRRLVFATDVDFPAKRFE